MRKILVILFGVLLCTAQLAVASKPYPFDDPNKATVYGTPPELMYPISEPAKLQVRSLSIKNRNVPSVFSYSSEMYYTTALQDEEAPLLFIVAGTGAEHDSAKMKFLTQAFYQAGYHVVALSSPTHMNFVVSVSEHAVPGYVPFDVADLYRVMLWVKADLEKECAVTEYQITGYSLGAMHAAFLAHKDSELKDFDFSKVLMINPPVSLYHSIRRLDSWLTAKNLGAMSVHDEIERIIELFSDYYERAEVTDLDDNFLYELVTHVDLKDKDLKALIGVDFRMSSSSMIFASDVCKRAGYLVPPDQYPLATGHSLMPYAEEAFEVSFEMYMNEYLIPYLQHLNPSLDKYTMLRQCSLYEIRSYLMKTDKIMLIGNRDDVILNDDDLAFIDRVFGKRAKLFLHGGHCGNLMFGPFVEAMVGMVKP